jgi:type I restriction-modification system DNA methylase subunit
MKKSNIRSKGTRTPDPFGATAYKTERTGVAVLMHWMRQIIEDKHLDLGLPDVETVSDDRKMPDLVIYESRRSRKILCLIEAKPPYYNVFSESELKEPAREKATRRNAPYFATTNFKRLVCFNTARVNAMLPDQEQFLDIYALAEIEDLNDLEQTRYSESIKKGLERFLTQLQAVHTGKALEPKRPVDEYLVLLLQEKIRVLSRYYTEVILDRYHKDHEFAASLARWFADQGWNFTIADQDFDKAAHQTAYLLVNKILFYDLLQAKRPHDLDPLAVPEGLTKGSMLQKTLQNYFDEVLKIDYETVYTTDFIDTIAFPDAKVVVSEIKELIRVLRRYDFSTLGYDIIGRIFERLIPADERHNLGQYFTNPDVVDIILRFCLRHEDDKVLDPACGAGTFLVRAYQHKKIMNQRLEHERALDTLWGADIAKFPAHLATINLAINDLGVDRNYPNILHADFFTLQVDDKGFANEGWRKRRAKTLGLQEREVTYPRWFDAVVGNPPYTRQEEIPEIGVDKENLIESALTVGDTQIATISKRAGIHAYFFVHGTKFLHDGGMFGFVVSNSWMDVDYGKGLQEFFLNNYKIVAILESKVERWFEDADVNTCIVILQKCKDKKERDANLARFVYLKKPLRHFLPPAQDMWDAQVARFHAIDDLKRTILAHTELYENEDLRIYPVNQAELREEGFDAETQRYIGAKWGKYLRAPDIFFTILLKAKGKLTLLREVADVETYLNTGGADDFFIVRPAGRTRDTVSIRNTSKIGGNKVFRIEAKYVADFVKSPRELPTIVMHKTDATWVLVLPPTDTAAHRGSLAADYTGWGESQKFHLRSGCQNRSPWWRLPKQAREPGVVLWSRLHDDTHIAYHNPDRIANTNFYSIWPKVVDPLIMALLLNATYFAMLKEFSGRVNFGLGVLKTEGSDVRRFVTVHPDLLIPYETGLRSLYAELGQRKIESIFSELGAFTPEEVSLDKVKPDRRALDQIVMGDILGLTDEEQLEVYRAVIDLVKSRIEKAKTFDKKKRVGGIDVESLKQTIIDRIDREEEE